MTRDRQARSAQPTDQLRVGGVDAPLIPQRVRERRMLLEVVETNGNRLVIPWVNP
jgi:hypothetical protein